ncbi:RNA ligase-domain-containing protein [Mycena rebaudengoi]|nr:RNA ligase-domain-containing protein [Mycena rebaudengoi]
MMPEDSSLVAKLQTIANQNPYLIKCTVYSAPADPSISVCSWKLDEYSYPEVPSSLPTRARGLFTMNIAKYEDNQEQNHRIVVRGYDNFFQIGEVPWNTVRGPQLCLNQKPEFRKWEVMEAHTAASYTVSLKSDGSIIFIGTLTPSKVLVTSKHTIGPIAEAAIGWLRKCLENRGNTEEQLATHLWENNWTAVAEPQVDAFSAEWGFFQTASVVLPSLDAVRNLTDDVSKTGTWNGTTIEGFVVRTQITECPPVDAKVRPPYASGSAFFFKVKLEEPYMFMSETTLSRSKMKRAETRVYVRWVMAEILRVAEMFSEYGEWRGIIAARDRFLAYVATPEGEQALTSEREPAGPSAVPTSPLVR